MKKVIVPVIFLVLGIAALALADGKKPESVTIEGEIIDIGCYASREARGPEHQACAARCLTNGNPAGVLDAEGNVYTIAATAPAFTALAAETVRVTGSLRGFLLKPSEMSVLKDGEWQPVALNDYGAPKTEESD